MIAGNDVLSAQNGIDSSHRQLLWFQLPYLYFLSQVCPQTLLSKLRLSLKDIILYLWKEKTRRTPGADGKVTPRHFFATAHSLAKILAFFALFFRAEIIAINKAFIGAIVCQIIIFGNLLFK